MREGDQCAAPVVNSKAVGGAASAGRRIQQRAMCQSSAQSIMCLWCSVF